MAEYRPEEIEPKWQAFWEADKTFKTPEDYSKPKYYVLDMFPYPSGAGLHVGHPEGYTATDILSRYKRMKGFNVLHPMGWDAFGLPAERAAMREGRHPSDITQEYIANFRRQIKRLGLAYDWDREIDTTDPKYYKWTQWILLKLYERGLAYEADVPVNWCPAQGTVLANEEVEDGKYKETGDPVFRRNMRQWLLKITVYAERLLTELDDVDWPESIKAMQRNWIGRSEGAELDFAVEGHDGAQVRVFTTRPDTLFGATYMVLAPEHPLVSRIVTEQERGTVEAYVLATSRKSEFDRTEKAKQKSGVFTGAYATNPVNGARLPIWIADYVLSSYGTGAIMAVPGHDERDWEFARQFSLPILEVISGGDVTAAAYAGDGQLVNSGFLDELGVDAAKQQMLGWLEERGIGERRVNYKLRDWLFSRQRYWGEPFPLIHTSDGKVKALPLDLLPLTLPHVDAYRPTEDGEPPLARAKEWLHTTDPETGLDAVRETNTMPQWAGSCWYYLRYIDPHNETAFVDPEKERYWMPVDLYVGGAEHAVLHLLYARFWHKVLYDCGLVSTREPFKRLFNQGMILAFSYKDEAGRYLYPEQTELRDGKPFSKADGAPLQMQVEKMSKSRFNVVNPDDVVAEFGADTLRLYEMYMGPLEATKPWQTDGARGMYRFLGRAYRLVTDEEGGLSPKVVDGPASTAETKLLHATIKKVGEDIEGMRFNTAVAAMIELVNALSKQESIARSTAEQFALLLSPFAPHLGEEIWALLGHGPTLAHAPWPTFDPSVLVESSIEIAVQVNGKLRGTIEAAVGAAEAEVIALAKANERVIPFLDGKQVVKEIYIVGKIVNLIVR